MSLELEAVVSRVATALRYLWPNATVDAYEEPHQEAFRITLTTRHGGQALCTGHVLSAWHLRDPGYWKHVMQDLPIRHAVELAHRAVDQAEAERYSSTKSTSLRGAYDDGSYSRP